MALLEPVNDTTKEFDVTDDSAAPVGAASTADRVEYDSGRLGLELA